MEKVPFNQYFQFYLYVYFLALSKYIIFGSEVLLARSIFPAIIRQVFLCASKRFVLASLSIMNQDFSCIDIEADHPLLNHRRFRKMTLDGLLSFRWLVKSKQFLHLAPYQWLEKPASSIIPFWWLVKPNPFRVA
ncbi:unnamed protein product [Cuscuta epithymum]|uniref:Uncharacterized protein n=1 Tax=Cuscuta epithymum TaxID=186058 RepID=A0AAV0BYG9_9ASTE|nr:unnamed protein product [Cuscuta epithymum]